MPSAVDLRLNAAKGFEFPVQDVPVNTHSSLSNIPVANAEVWPVSSDGPQAHASVVLCLVTFCIGMQRHLSGGCHVIASRFPDTSHD